jgi:transcriptional repressor NrdR
MNCPYCHKPLTYITNSRPTRNNNQVWRRRHCSNCGEIFTTHEIIDLSHLVVAKKSGEVERFSQAKLYSGIYGATIGSKLPNREYIVDKITREVSSEILSLKRKKITSQEISNIVLNKLKTESPATFLRFLAYNKNPKTETQILKEILKYISR